MNGSWNKGSRIKFLAPSGDGMVAEIADNRPHEFISIRHLGFIANGVEDTESDAVRAWASAYENYTFRGRATAFLVATVFLIAPPCAMLPAGIIEPLDFGF